MWSLFSEPHLQRMHALQHEEAGKMPGQPPTPLPAASDTPAKAAERSLPAPAPTQGGSGGGSGEGALTAPACQATGAAFALPRQVSLFQRRCTCCGIHATPFRLARLKNMLFSLSS